MLVVIGRQADDAHFYNADPSESLSRRWIKKASTVHDLKMILLHYWPVTDGPSFVNALVACQEALDGGKSVEKAREAFFMAAREADVAVVGE